MNSNKKIRTSHWAFICMLFFAQHGFAADHLPTFRYHPDINWVIGQGVDLKNPSRSVFTCVQPRGTTGLIEKDRPLAAQNVPLEISLVTSKAEYRHEMGIDASFEARKLFGGSKAELHAKTEGRLESDSVALILSHSARFMPERLVRHFELLPEIQKLVDQGNWREFRKQCGNAMVSEVKKELGVRVVVLISGFSKESKSSLRVKAEGGINAGLAKVHFKAEVFANWSNLEKQRRIEVKAITFGGDGLSVDADLVKAALQPDTKLDLLGDALAKKASQMTAKDAASVEFKLIRYPGLPEDDSSETWVESERDNLLSKIVNAHELLSAKIAAVQELLDRRDSSGRIAAQPWTAKSLLSDAQEELDLIQARLPRIARAHQKCLEAESDNLRTSCQIPVFPRVGYGAFEIIAQDLGF